MDLIVQYSTVKQTVLFFSATSIGITLFLLMQMLIHTDDIQSTRDKNKIYLNFVHVDNADTELQTKKHLPPEQQSLLPPQIPSTNPVMPKQPNDLNAVLNMPVPHIGIPIHKGSGPYLGTLTSANNFSGIDSEVTALFRVPPVYPPRAMHAGIEGYVTVIVSINEDGDVQNAEVLESNPPRLFDRAAIEAIKRWKFQPKTSNGRPVTHRAQQSIDFKLDY